MVFLSVTCTQYLMYTTYICTCRCMHIICTMTPNKHFHQLLLTNSVSLIHSSHQRFPIMQCICRVPRTLTKLHPHLLLHFELPFVSFITCFWDQQFAVWTILEKWLQNFCEIWGAPNFILFLGLSIWPFFANISFITCFWDHQWSVNILEKWLQDKWDLGKNP